MKGLGIASSLGMIDPRVVRVNSTQMSRKANSEIGTIWHSNKAT